MARAASAAPHGVMRLVGARQPQPPPPVARPQVPRGASVPGAAPPPDAAPLPALPLLPLRPPVPSAPLEPPLPPDPAVPASVSVAMTHSPSTQDCPAGHLTAAHGSSPHEPVAGSQ